MRWTRALAVAALLATASCGGPRIFERAVTVDAIYDTADGSGASDQIVMHAHYVEGAEGSFTSADIPEGWRSLPRSSFVDGLAMLSEPLTLAWTPWTKSPVRGPRDPVSGVQRARLPRRLHSFDPTDAERAEIALRILDLGGDAYRVRLSETTSGPIVVSVALDGAVVEPSSPHGVGWVELSSWTYQDIRSRGDRSLNRVGTGVYITAASIIVFGGPILFWVLVLA